jgi:endoglucanase
MNISVRGVSRSILALLTSLVCSGCGETADECAPGSEGCACYGNKSCDDGLSCFSNLCVQANDGTTGSHVDRGDAGAESRGSETNSASSSGNDNTRPGGNSDPDGNSSGAGSDGNASSDAPSSDTATPITPGKPPSGSPVAKHGQLSVVGTHLVDKDGKKVQLKGVSSMWLNWERDGYAEDKEGLRYMRDNWNLSLIRAAMGVEAGDNSPTYLKDPEHAKAQVETIVRNAIELGVYVIIDWHDHDAIGNREQAKAFFSEMAEKYGSTPNVMYEVFNEPLDVSWDTELKPYHESLRDTIRAKDADNIILLGTPNWDQDVDIAADNPLGGDNLMYVFHFYSCSHTRQYFLGKVNYALSRGVPLFVSEWGAATADGIDTDASCISEASGWHDWMDENSISWAAWKFDNCSDATCFFVDSAVPTNGNWTEAQLNGLHPQFAIQRMKNQPSPEVEGPGPQPEPNDCTPTGSCAAGNAMDCDADGELVERDCSACALLPDPDDCHSVSHFGAVSRPVFSVAPQLVKSFTASSSVATLNMAFDFSAFPSADEQIGAIAFALSGNAYVEPLWFETCIEATDDEHVQVSFENGASGCLYPLTLLPVDGICRPAYIADPDYDGICWGAWELNAYPGEVSQVNMRIGSFTSGARTLEVRSLTW